MSRNYKIALGSSTAADAGLTCIFSRWLQAAEAFRSRRHARGILRILTLAVLALGLSMPAVADSLAYTFNFDAKGGVDPFTVSFTTPSFLTSGQSITFTPFNITDGTNTWSITQGEASQLGSGGPACLEFATASGGIINPCAAGTVGPPPGAGITIELADGLLPTAIGTYAISHATVLVNPGEGSSSTDSSLEISSLNTTPTPEPASISLVGIGVVLMGRRLYMRRGDLAGKRRLDPAR
jgi:hypothetical protein